MPEFRTKTELADLAIFLQENLNAMLARAKTHEEATAIQNHHDEIVDAHHLAQTKILNDNNVKVQKQLKKLDDIEKQIRAAVARGAAMAGTISKIANAAELAKSALKLASAT